MDPYLRIAGKKRFSAEIAKQQIYFKI